MQDLEPGVLRDVSIPDEEKFLASNGPSVQELILLWLAAALFFLIAIHHFRSYLQLVANFGDNERYAAAASAIRRWDFTNLQVKQFWGFPYLISAFSFAGLSMQWSLLLICFASSLASVLLVRNLWGPWIAAYFAFLNFTWLQVSFLGGAEPLFVLLLLGSFFFGRRRHWVASSALAALATLVRPLGALALLGIGLSLLWRREYKKAFFATLIASVIGGVYLLPFWLYYHDALYQFHRYRQADWQGGSSISWPFHAIASSFLHNREPFTNEIFTAAWIAFAAAGLALMLQKRYRGKMGGGMNEYVFACSYLLFLFCYSSVHWARAEFPRFAIAVLPFLLLAFERWLPKSRSAVYALAGVSTLLGACSAIGIRNVLAGLR